MDLSHAGLLALLVANFLFLLGAGMGFLGPQLSLGECSQSKPRSPLLGYG